MTVNNRTILRDLEAVSGGKGKKSSSKSRRESEEPLGTESYWVHSKGLYDCCLLIRQKRPLYYSAQLVGSRHRSVSWGLNTQRQVCWLYLSFMFIKILKESWQSSRKSSRKFRLLWMWFKCALKLRMNLHNLLIWWIISWLKFIAVAKVDKLCR